MTQIFTDSFLSHIYISDLGSLEDNLGTLYLYSNRPLLLAIFFFFFVVYLSRLGFYIFKSLLYSQWKWMF